MPAKREAEFLGRRPKGTGRQFAYDFLRQRILRLEYPPGETLDEMKLVEEMGVSRTLVREAIITLSTEDLVELLPNRSARVADFDVRSVRAFHEALELNQRAVTCWAALRSRPAHHAEIRRARLAFERAASARNGEVMIDSNRLFHLAIAKASGNSLVESSYRRLLTIGLRLSRLLVTYDFSSDVSLASHLDRIVDDHREMEHAIIEGDAERAEKLGGTHAQLSLTRALAALSNTMAERVSLPRGHE